MANYFAKQNICQSNQEHRNVQGNGNEAQSGDGGSQAETLQEWGMLLGGGALTVYALARRRFFEEVDVVDFLKDATGNRGPDSCMDAVGMEASGHSLFFPTDRAK